MKTCHTIDPRVFFFVNTTAALVAVIAQDLIILAATLTCICLLSIIASVNLFRILFKLRYLLTMILSVVILQSIFTQSGKILVQAGQVILLTSDGVVSGAIVLLRMLILILGGVMTASCGIRRGAEALIKLKIPYEIAFMVCISFHFIPLLGQQIQDALVAIQLRGIDLKRIKLRHRFKVYTYLFLPIITSALVKARDLAASLELRGFRAYSKRTSLTTLKMRATDYLLIAVFGVGFIAAMCVYYSV